MSRHLPRTFLSLIITYVLLAAYFNLIPLLLPMGDVLRFIHLLSFFAVAYLIAKLCYGKGLDLYGVVLHPGWRSRLGIGFLLGFAAWAVLFALYFSVGDYHWQGLNINSQTGMTIAAVVLGYGVGSFISDMIVRGFVFTHLAGKLAPKYVFSLSLLLYALDDMWYEGFDWQNTIFSLALGLGLTYAYYRTNSVWASAGMHFGLNTVYGLFFGVSGHPGDGIVLFATDASSSWHGSWLSTILSLLLFLAAWLVFHKQGRERQRQQTYSIS